MATLEIKLKQHTPLIHFQWEQEDATLRASEVKPKLDKFIIRELGGIDEIRQQHRDWLIGNGNHEALNYKMKIKCTRNRDEYLITSNTMTGKSLKMANRFEENNISFIPRTPYFADEFFIDALAQGLEQHPDSVEYKGKKGIMWSDIELCITVFEPLLRELIQVLKDNIRQFFICENFGTRQNKGFGCFEIIEIKDNDDYKEWRLNKQELEECLKENFDFAYKRFWKEGEDREIPIILKTIQDDYRVMKSGLNIPIKDNPIYKKSLLFHYAVTEMPKEPRWEKRKLKKIIKEKLDQVNRRDSLKLCLKAMKNKSGEYNEPIYGIGDKEQAWKDEPSSYTYYFLRGLLGLTEQYSFKLNVNEYEVIVTVKDVHSQIERYRSPVMFKVVENEIYLLGKNEDADKTIKGSKFQFDMWLVKPDKSREYLGQELLEIPSDFCLNKFINFTITRRFLKYRNIG